MRDGFKRLLSAFLSLFFVGIGVALLCLATQNLNKAKTSANWTSTDGIILYTDYERTSAGRRTSNAPHVSYGYQVEGRNYTSDILSFGDDLSDSEVFERYPSGRSVTVYFDLNNPQESTLVKGVGTQTIAGVRYAQVILSLALAFLVYVTITEVNKHRNLQAGASDTDKPPN